jgi:SWI/SNF-related matrix-associated actin-dependent regulator of chromatin subfamily A3
LSAGNLLKTQVAPLSVLSNWSTQLEEHITEDAGIKAHVYYGDGKNVSASFLKRQDVVITTYQSVTTDLPSTKTIKNPDGTESIQVAATQSGLFAVRWKV